jgi:hypothetical protein
MDDGTEESDDLEQYVLRLLDECRDEVKMSDSKTNIMFGIVAAATAFVLDRLADSSSELRTNGDLVVTLAIAATLTFLTSFVLLALAVTPRLVTPESGKARYFREIAQFHEPQQLLDVLSADAAHSVVRHTQQLHVLSRIVQRKYRHLRDGMRAIAAGVLLLALAMLVGALR